MTAPTTYAGTVQLEGQSQEFRNDDPAATAATGPKLRDGQTVTCRLVRNASGVALLPKRVVTWTAAYRGRRVAGYCRVDAEEVAGVVDEHLPAAGCPTDDLFWLCVDGPHLVTMPASAVVDVVEGDVMFALTATTAQQTASTTSGRIQPWTGLTSTATASTDGTHTKRIINALGRAMSAKNSSSTNGDLLVDIRLLKQT
jgi:ketosteroid isomerase-like protein